MRIKYKKAHLSDFEDLVELRIEAMREGLLRIGRFDRGRSIERFRASFVPEDTIKIESEGRLVGFYAATEMVDHIYLDHLYVSPAYQNAGIGSAVMKKLIQTFKEQRLPIRLCALKESRSIDFYKKHGFVVITESEFDVCFERKK